MAKLEIPSIVVQNGSGSCTSTSKSSGMESTHSGKPKSKLSKQAEFEETDDFDSDVIDVTAGDSVEDDKVGQEIFNKHIIDDGSDALNRSDSTDSDKDVSGSTKVRPHSKVKLLVRSHAVRDDTSPPPPCDLESANTLSVFASAANLGSQVKTSKSKRLGKQGSSQGSATSFEGSSSSLSRESSTEAYTDSTGIDLQQFIVDTLHKNQKDRMMLLKIESELICFIREAKHAFHKFPQMSSYHRMLVHRCAAFFGLDHNVDPNGTSVIVNRTKSTRIPDFKFSDQIKDELLPHEPRKSILKRDCASFDEKEYRASDRNFADTKKSKSFEEREEEYEKARARIFNQDEGIIDPSMLSGPVTLYGRASDGSTVLISSSQLSSQEDVRWAMIEPRPWSSTDSDSSGRLITLPVKSCLSPDVSVETVQLIKKQGGKFRPQIVKAHSDCQDFLSVERVRRAPITKASSFCGMPCQQSESGHSLLAFSKFDSLCNTSGITVPSTSSIVTLKAPSPQMAHPESSSSSYSSSNHQQQQHMTSPQQPFAHILPMQNSNNQESSVELTWKSSNQTSDVNNHINPANTPTQSQVQPQQQQSVMWAVSSFDSVPPGSVLINPVSGMPYLNPDGTVYRHNPSVTPIIYQAPPSNTTESSSVQQQPAMNIQQNPPAPQQQVIYYTQQGVSQQTQSQLPHQESATETEFVNQFAIMNMGQSQLPSANQEALAAEPIQPTIGATTPLNGTSYSCISQPSPMCIVPTQVPQTGISVYPQQSSFNNQPTSIYYPQQPMAMANQPQHVQPVPQPSQQPLAGFAMSGGGNYIQQSEQSSVASPYYSIPSSQNSFQQQNVLPIVKSANYVIGSSPVQCSYAPPNNSPMMPVMTASRNQPGIVGMPQFTTNQNQHPVTPTSITSSPAPQFPSSFASNPFSSINMLCPNVQVIPGGNGTKSTITPPPSHNILAQMSSSPQLNKGCTYPPIDSRFSEHINPEQMNNADFQLKNAHMHQRSRFASSPILRTPMLIPRQPLMARVGQQWPQQATLTHKTQKVRKQRSRNESSSNGNILSTDSSANSSQSQTPTSGGRGNALEVQSYPNGMKLSEMDHYLEEITDHGGKLEYVSFDGNKNSAITGTSDLMINSTKYRIFAVFESETASQSALLNIQSSKFILRPLSQSSQ